MTTSEEPAVDVFEDMDFFKGIYETVWLQASFKNIVKFFLIINSFLNALM